MLRQSIALAVALLFVAGTSFAQGVGVQRLEVKEDDGSPTVMGVGRIVVSDGTLTEDGEVSGKEQVTIITGGGGGGLPSGGNIDNLIENTGSGTGAWVDPDTVTVGTATALENNPDTCPGDEYVKDIDADGTLNCADPLIDESRTLDELTDVAGLIGSSGYYIQHINESLDAGDVPVYDASGNLTTSGSPPAGAADVEDHTSSCGAGDGFISTGSQVDCSGIATQAELDAASILGPSYQGEYAVFADTSWGSNICDTDDESAAILSYPVNYHEVYDRLDHWIGRTSQAGCTVDGAFDNEVCYEPPMTYRVFINDYCSGTFGSGNDTDAPGTSCTGDGDCPGAATCLPALYVQDEPDQITLTAHGFGASTTTYPLPLAFNKAGSSGLDKSGPTNWITGCADGVAMGFDVNWWAYVVDANTIQLCEDDGDLKPECDGDDKWLDCTSVPAVAQSFVLYPRNANGDDPTRHFRASMMQSFEILDQVDPDPDLAMPPWKIGTYFLAGPHEGVGQSGIIVGGSQSYHTVRYSGEWVSVSNTGLAPMNPGDCLLHSIGYMVGSVDDDLDSFGKQEGGITITEALMGVPLRESCDFSASGSVGASCMRYGRITNRTASAAIELELAPFEAGMDFIVVNESSSSYNITVDPDSTERFLSPATDTDGDKLLCDTEGEAIRVYVNTNGEARVEFMEGTCNDDGT
jgi:hypothetical protein